MKTIQITDEQYELLEQEKEHVNSETSTVEFMSEFMACYATVYGPDPSFTTGEARGIHR